MFLGEAYRADLTGVKSSVSPTIHVVTATRAESVTDPRNVRRSASMAIDRFLKEISVE